MCSIKVSFIVPVYNTSQYIEKCLQSIVDQKIDNYEIVIVNDGSIDDSEIRIQQFTERNSDVRIKYINQRNAGLSIARNHGVEISCGEYIHFVDSDDSIFPDSYYPVMNAIEQNHHTDIFEIGFSVRRNENIIRTVRPFGDSEHYLYEALSSGGYEWYAWKYIIRKSYWEQHNFHFPAGKKYEDVFIMPRVLASTDHIKGINVQVYDYILGRPGAITNGVKLLPELDKLTANCENMKYFLNQNCTYKKDILENFSHAYFSALIVLYAMKGEERNQLYQSLKEKKWMVKYAKQGMYNILSKVVQLLGIKFTARILYIRMRLKNG